MNLKETILQVQHGLKIVPFNSREEIMSEIIQKQQEIIDLQNTTLRDLRYGLFPNEKSINDLIDSTLEKTKQLMEG